jgi:hypothetical protein
MLFLNRCLLLYEHISLSSQSENFCIHPHKYGYHEYMSVWNNFVIKDVGAGLRLLKEQSLKLDIFKLHDPSGLLN